MDPDDYPLYDDPACPTEPPPLAQDNIDVPTGDILEIPFRLYSFMCLKQSIDGRDPLTPSLTIWNCGKRWHISLHHRAARLVTYWSDESLQECLNHLELGLKVEALRWRPSRDRAQG